jgi:superfamily II DNA/RNA helicase
VVYHLRNNNFDPKTIQTLVLDEFDKALELGFHDDMEFISNSLKGLVSENFNFRNSNGRNSCIYRIKR